MSTPLLHVDNLGIAYRNSHVWRKTTHDISFEIAPGEALALVGESGSGKTTTAQAIIGLLPENARIETGAVFFDGADITAWSAKRRQSLNGRSISLIPQDPANALDPLMRIGSQIAEIFKIHNALRGAPLRRQVLELLEQVGINDPERRARQYPHELSGGMKQRVLIAIAIALKPWLIIADEPTSALDATVQNRILDLIDTIRRDNGAALLMVTHDLGVASDRADRVVVMHKGRVEESGISQAVLSAPQTAYTRALLANDPALTPAKPRAPAAAQAKAVISVRNLGIAYSTKQTARTVDALNLEVARGSTHAIVGESGSGKTSTIRALCGFIKPVAGSILIDNTDIATLSGETLHRFRRRIQLVYQNPFGSLDPRQTIGDLLAEPLKNYEKIPKTVRQSRAREMLHQVELPQNLFERRAHALSGGQRQRVAIARALILEPEIVVLDEAVSALDVTVQAQILDLLDRLQKQSGLTYVFVSHDLAVVRRIADTVSVMQAGRLVESGRTDDIFTRPAHPYTRELISAIPGRHHALHHSYLSSQL